MKVAVEVPASSANLGVGFDALAMALELRLRVEVETLPGRISELQVAGEGAGRLGLNDANRFVAGLRRGLEELEAADAGTAWRIEMENEIPLGRGLGSSAASFAPRRWLAGSWGRFGCCAWRLRSRATRTTLLPRCWADSW